MSPPLPHPVSAEVDPRPGREAPIDGVRGEEERQGMKRVTREWGPEEERRGERNKRMPTNGNTEMEKRKRQPYREKNLWRKREVYTPGEY